MRVLLGNGPITLYSNRVAAEALAAKLTASDECGWSYPVVETAAGRFVIDVHDDENLKVGTL